MTVNAADAAPAAAAAAPAAPVPPVPPMPVPPPDVAAGVRDKPNFLGIVKSCAANVPPRIRASAPSLEAFRASPHAPVVATPDPSQGQFHATPVTYNGSTDLTQQLPLNGVGGPRGDGCIEWENDVFKGRIYVHLRGLPTSDEARFFAGRKRFTWGFAQGEFKKAVR